MRGDRHGEVGFQHGELIALIPQMRALAHCLCGDRTLGDRLAQAAMLNAWRNRDAYGPGTGLRAWLFAIVHDQFRSGGQRARPASRLDRSTLDGADLDDVRRAVQALPCDEREAVVLVDMAGVSCAEAAALCGCTEDAVRRRVGRARARLPRILSRGHPVDHDRRAAGPARQPAGRPRRAFTLVITRPAA